MKSGRPEDALGFLKPGMRIYIQGGPGECEAFIDLLRANPGAGKGVELWSCLIPGINTFDYGSLPDGPNLVTFMASPSLEPSIAAGRTRIDAMPYSEIAATLSRTDFDLAILDVNLKGESVWPVASALRVKGTPFVLATGGHVDPPPAEFENVPTIEKPYTIDRVTPIIEAVLADADH